jgi:hypothetical protein
MQKPRLFGMNGFLLFLFSFFSFAVHAQQEGNLILIDAEGKQAFTIRLGEELFASTSQGHLVLSHLKDSIYKLNLRFPKMNQAEQVFPVVVHKKDLGFQLREVNGSWILYNWQTKETVHSVYETDSSRILDMGIKRDDGFSKLMAAVVNDTAVLYNTYTGAGFAKDTVSTGYKEPASLPAPGLADAGKKNSQTSIANSPPQPVNPAPAPIPVSGGKGKPGVANPSQAEIQQPVKNAVPSRDSIQAGVKSPTANGKALIANSQSPVADSAGKNIPPPSTARAGSEGQIRQSSTANRSPDLVPEIRKLREVNLKISRKLVFLDRGKDGKADTVTLFVYFESKDTLKKQKVPVESGVAKKATTADSAGAQVKSKPALKPLSSGCGQLATDADAETLRSAILQANSEQDKISAATQAFGQKCFSVSQIRMLASLLVSDKSRYRLMEAASSHIADRDHFRELADMYTDKNFQKKFLVLAEKRS